MDDVNRILRDVLTDPPNDELPLSISHLSIKQKLALQIEEYECGHCKSRHYDRTSFLAHTATHTTQDKNSTDNLLPLDFNAVGEEVMEPYIQELPESLEILDETVLSSVLPAPDVNLSTGPASVNENVSVIKCTEDSSQSQDCEESSLKSNSTKMVSSKKSDDEPDTNENIPLVEKRKGRKIFPSKRIRQSPKTENNNRRLHENRDVASSPRNSSLSSSSATGSRRKRGRPPKIKEVIKSSEGRAPDEVELELIAKRQVVIKLKRVSLENDSHFGLSKLACNRRCKKISPATTDSTLSENDDCVVFDTDSIESSEASVISTSRTKRPKRPKNGIKVDSQSTEDECFIVECSSEASLDSTAQSTVHNFHEDLLRGQKALVYLQGTKCQYCNFKTTMEEVLIMHQNGFMSDHSLHCTKLTQSPSCGSNGVNNASPGGRVIIPLKRHELS